MKLKIELLLLLFLISGCINKGNIDISMRNSKIFDKGQFGISNIQVANNQIIINGSNLSSVDTFEIKEGSSSTILLIESKSNNSIIANTVGNVTFAAGKIFNFILSNANAASTFTVNFSLCDSTLAGKGFNCLITPNDKDVMSFDAATNKWTPRNVNGLNYKGAHDASTTVDPGGSPLAGDYYIISMAGTINGESYAVGDWIVYNEDEIAWQKVSNSKDVLSVFGRTGKISAKKGDYSLTHMGDVDFTTAAPTEAQVLQFISGKWVPRTYSSSASAGAGSLTTPSYAFSSSPSTGLFSPATNHVGIVNNGVETVRINSTGNVGIGSLNPTVKLDVTGSFGSGISYAIPASGTQLMFTDYNLGLPMISLKGQDNTRTSYINSLGPLNIYSGGTSPLTGSLAIATDINGNVGIGTATPGSALDVKGAIISSTVTLVTDPTVSGINWATGNIQYTSASCVGEIWNMTNLKAGATYTFVVQGTAHTDACQFSESGGATFKFQPGNGPPAAGYDVVYSITKVGGSVYVAWIDSW